MMEFQPAQRLHAFRTGIFNELARYKQELLAQGKEIIDLSVGSPDLPPPPFIIQALQEHIQDQRQYGYTLGAIDSFHEAVAAFYKERYGVMLDPQQEVLQMMGSQDGLVHLPLVCADPGDLILVPDPGYTAYESGVRLAEAVPYPLPLRPEHDFLPDLSQVPEDIARKAKVLILNFPGNPVPALAPYAFFEEVVRFARKYEIIVVHDFAYSELVFDRKKPVSFLEVPGAKEVGVEFNSFSKSFNMAGCRIGYMVGNRQVIEALGRLKSNLDYGVFSPVQQAAIVALQQGMDFLNDNARLYEQRRNVLIESFGQQGWHVDKPPATMFCWAAVPAGWRSTDFVYALLDRAGVVVTPGNAFGENGEGYVRIALVQDAADMKKAAQRIGESGIIKTHTLK
jgi:LL-diaminopimelate aminotransferase